MFVSGIQTKKISCPQRKEFSLIMSNLFTVEENNHFGLSSEAVAVLLGECGSFISPKVMNESRCDKAFWALSVVHALEKDFTSG